MTIFSEFLLRTSHSAIFKETIEIKGEDIAEDVHQLHFPYVKKYKTNKEYNHYFKFCFVRNPWDRLVSCYKNKISFDESAKGTQVENNFIRYLKKIKAFKQGMTFDEFVDVVSSIADEKSESHFERQRPLFLCAGCGVRRLFGERTL